MYAVRKAFDCDQTKPNSTHMFGCIFRTVYPRTKRTHEMRSNRARATNASATERVFHGLRLSVYVTCKAEAEECGCAFETPPIYAFMLTHKRMISMHLCRTCKTPCGAFPRNARPDKNRDKRRCECERRICRVASMHANAGGIVACIRCEI